jgi:hypothetical protein
MFLEQYFSERTGKISFTREQGSDFAKRVADDFNPLHDVEATRFCIPGDLLFSIILSRYGISQHMEFIFSGMVPAGIELILPESASELPINDAQDKQYLRVLRSGEASRDETLIENLTRDYVEFSGHTFPHLLVPLMAQENLMINPLRPMVMYQSMSISLDRLDIRNPTLQLDQSTLEINGKRGNAVLTFNFVESGKIVGRGEKHLLLSGLREYDEHAVNGVVVAIDARRKAFNRENNSVVGTVS